MTPLLFGAESRRLFGMLHAPEEGRALGRGLLMCNPFGHEAIRIHRLYRVLAERLARTGWHVLRFDYFGTGDSAGDDEQGELSGWVDDICVAHAQLQQLSGASSIEWLGARLGASLAVEAAAHSGPQRLLLWDPILDGSAYSDLLRIKHVEALELSYCIPDVDWRRQLADQSAFQDEAIGFATSAQLREQLIGLKLPSRLPPTVELAVVLAKSDDLGAAAWVRQIDGPVSRARLDVLDHSLVWTSDPQPNMAMVPAEALARLTRELEGAS